jgi:hypothetical protein
MHCRSRRARAATSAVFTQRQTSRSCVSCRSSRGGRLLPSLMKADCAGQCANGPENILCVVLEAEWQPGFGRPVVLRQHRRRSCLIEACRLPSHKQNAPAIAGRSAPRRRTNKGSALHRCGGALGQYSLPVTKLTACCRATAQTPAPKRPPSARASRWPLGSNCRRRSPA